VAKIYEPQKMTVHVGEQIVLPDSVSILLFDGSMEKKQVKWNYPENVAFYEVGEYSVEGMVADINETVNACICVTEKTEERENLLMNTDWEQGFDQWELESSKEQVIYQIYPEFIDPYPAPPVNAIRVEGNKNFTFKISQTLAVPEEGKYLLKVEFQGTDTTGVDVRLFAQQGEVYKEMVIHPTEHGYEVCCLGDLKLMSGRADIGIKISAPPMYGMMRRFALIKE
jgi:arabinogalactan endo-1,4-beta-galactosidase